jgi:uncharacterized protein
VGFAQQNAADQPASKEDVEKYMEVAHSRKLMDDMMAVMTTQMHKMIHDQVAKTPTLPPDFEARETKIIDDIFRNFPWEEMLQAMVPIYQKHFTKVDIEVLTAFYSAPTGQKFLKETPAMTAEMMQTMMPLIQKQVAKATEQLEQDVAQLQKQNGANSKKQQPAQN